LAKATFEEAKRICEKDGMEMLSFDNTKELSKITDYISYIGKLIFSFN
jgi:hypothetical protein